MRTIEEGNEAEAKKLISQMLPGEQRQAWRAVATRLQSLSVEQHAPATWSHVPNSHA